MVNQAITTIAVKYKIPIKVMLFCANSRVRRYGFTCPLCCHMCDITAVCLSCATAFLLMFTQSLVITLLATCHHRQHIVSATSHIPFEDCTTMLRVDIQILLVTFNNQLVLCVPVEIREFIVLPMV